MIRIDDRQRLVWSEPDLNKMAHVVGEDAAIKLRCPYNAAILKAALRRGVRPHPKATEQLAREEIRRKNARFRARLDDWSEGPEHFWKHQRVALHFADKLFAWLLADDVGVGKTFAAIQWALMRSRTLDRKLVICRAAARYQWARAIRTLDADSEITIVEGRTLDQIMAARWPDGWVIAHWDALARLGKAFTRGAWRVVLADESHQAQNRDAKRTETLQHLTSDFRCAMTGHPYWHAPDQLFPILQWLYPERYTSYWRFFWLHVRATPKFFGGYDIDGPRRPKLLKWELSEFTLRRTKRKVFPNLPAITRTPRHVELTKRGRDEYDRLRTQFFVKLDALKGKERTLAIPSILARTTRLRQYLVDPGLLGARERSPKYDELIDLMLEIDKPVVVFSSFAQALERFNAYAIKQKRSRHFKHGFITGEHRKFRELTRKRFLGGQLNGLLVTIGAGSESLNLGKYGYVISLDLPWTTRDLQQSEGRVDRPEEGTGKLVATTAYRIIVRDSYEERMEERLMNEHANFKQVWTVNDLKELFAA